MENKENETLESPLSPCDNGEVYENIDSIGTPKSAPGTPDLKKDLETSDDSENETKFVSDFDTMWDRKMAARQRRRNLADYHERMVGRLIQKMKEAVVEDRILVLERKPAFHKIGMLREVIEKISKPEMHQMFIENNILEVITDWLVPLSNFPRPSFQLVFSLLEVLDSFPSIDKAQLKESRIGKAVMYYYKLPDVDKSVRDLAQKILYNWARPIYNISCDLKSYPVDERRSKDQDIQDRFKLNAGAPVPKKKRKTFLEALDEKADCDDDGYYERQDWTDNTPRARIPMPSNKTYYVRPVPKITTPFEDGKKKRKSRKKDIPLFEV